MKSHHTCEAFVCKFNVRVARMEKILQIYAAAEVHFGHHVSKDNSKLEIYTVYTKNECLIEFILRDYWQGGGGNLFFITHGKFLSASLQM